MGCYTGNMMRRFQWFGGMFPWMLAGVLAGCAGVPRAPEQSQTPPPAEAAEAHLVVRAGPQGPVATLKVAEDGAVQEREIACTIVLLEWHAVLTPQPSGGLCYTWEERQIPLDLLPVVVKVRSGEETPLHFGDLHPGRYRLTATQADGTSAQMEFLSGFRAEH